MFITGDANLVMLSCCGKVKLRMCHAEGEDTGGGVYCLLINPFEAMDIGQTQHSKHGDIALQDVGVYFPSVRQISMDLSKLVCQVQPGNIDLVFRNK